MQTRRNLSAIILLFFVSIFMDIFLYYWNLISIDIIRIDSIATIITLILFMKRKFPFHETPLNLL